MTQLLNDTFTAANQPLSSYSSDYVREAGSDNESRIVDNALRFDTGGFAATEKWHNSAVTIPDGGFVQATWTASNTSGLAGIILYVDDNNKYMLLCNANELYMARIRNGSYSVVGPRQAPPFPISDGVTVKLKKTGTLLEAFYGDLDNPVYSYDNGQNDFGSSGMYPGYENIKADLIMDNFIADDGQSVGGSDTTDPVISLNAASSITIEIGDTYTPPAVTATDDTDGDITGSITVSGDDFDTSVVGGPYEVIFSVSDVAGNSSSVSQFVTVVDGQSNTDSTPLLLNELVVNTVTTVIPKSKTTGTKSPGLGMVDGHSGSAYSPDNKTFIALYGSETHNSKNAWNSYFAIDFDQTLAQLNSQLVDDWKTRPWQQWGNDSDYPVAGFGAVRNEFRSYLDAGQVGADDENLGPYNPPCHSYHLDEQVIQNDLGDDLLLSTFSSTSHMFLSAGHDYAPDDSSRFAVGNLGYRIFTESGASNTTQTPIINLSDYSEDSMIVTDVGQHSNADKVISERGRAWIDDRTFYGSDVNNGMVYKATVDVVGTRVTVTDYQSGLTPFGLWPYHEHLKQIIVGDYLTAFYGETSKGKFFHIAKVTGLSDSDQHLSISLDTLKSQNNILCDDGVSSIWDTTATVNYPVTRVSDNCIAMIAYDGTDGAQKSGRLLLWKIPTHDGTSWDGIGEVVDSGLRYDYVKAAGNSYQFNITNIQQYPEATYVPFVDKSNDQWDLQIGKLVKDTDTYFGNAPVDTTPPVITLNGPSTLQITQGDTYTPSNATATDETDGSVAVVVTGDDFDTNIVGTYTVTFTATDAANNSSSETQTVTVVEDSSGNTYQGVLGSEVPSTGKHSPSVIYRHLDLPTEASDYFYAVLVGTPPSGLTFEENGSYVITGLPVGMTQFSYQVYKNDVPHLGIQTWRIAVNAS